MFIKCRGQETEDRSLTEHSETDSGAATNVQSEEDDNPVVATNARETTDEADIEAVGMSDVDNSGDSEDSARAGETVQQPRVGVTTDDVGAPGVTTGTSGCTAAATITPASSARRMERLSDLTLNSYSSDLAVRQVINRAARFLNKEQLEEMRRDLLIQGYSSPQYAYVQDPTAHKNRIKEAAKTIVWPKAKFVEGPHALLVAERAIAAHLGHEPEHCGPGSPWKAAWEQYGKETCQATIRTAKNTASGGMRKDFLGKLEYIVCLGAGVSLLLTLYSPVSASLAKLAGSRADERGSAGQVTSADKKYAVDAMRAWVGRIGAMAPITDQTRTDAQGKYIRDLAPLVSADWVILYEVYVVTMVGKNPFKRSVGSTTLRKFTNRTDVALAITLLENNCDRWLDEFLVGKADRKAKSKWSNEKKNSGATKFGGWTQQGINRYSELCRMLKKKQRSEEFRAFELSFLDKHKPKVEVGGSVAGGSGADSTAPGSVSVVMHVETAFDSDEDDEDDDDSGGDDNFPNTMPASITVEGGGTVEFQDVHGAAATNQALASASPTSV